MRGRAGQSRQGATVSSSAGHDPAADNAGAAWQVEPAADGRYAFWPEAGLYTQLDYRLFDDTLGATLRRCRSEQHEDIRGGRIVHCACLFGLLQNKTLQTIWLRTVSTRRHEPKARGASRLQNKYAYARRNHG